MLERYELRLYTPDDLDRLEAQLARQDAPAAGAEGISAQRLPDGRNVFAFEREPGHYTPWVTRRSLEHLLRREHLFIDPAAYPTEAALDRALRELAGI